MNLVVLCPELSDHPKGGGVASISPYRIGMLCEPNGLKTGFGGLSSDGTSLSTAAFDKRSKTT